MGRKSRDGYERALGLRETETSAAKTFAADFPGVTGRSVYAASGAPQSALELRHFEQTPSVSLVVQVKDNLVVAKRYLVAIRVSWHI